MTDSSMTDSSMTDSSSPIIVRHYCVEGRVQGVGFRWFVHREAAALGLRGAVRNTESGCVEVIAAGTADLLAKLRTELEKGSRGSRVDRVQEEDLPPGSGDALGAFTIEGAW
jgi:acylphosphatase